MEKIKLGVYRHYKGKEYRVLMEGVNDETREPVIIYIPLYGEGEITVRKKSVFLDEVDEPEFNYKGPRFVFVKE